MTSVLVIDDDPLVRDSVRRVLERAGLTVDVAGGGHEGMERIGKAEPDLIVTDILMPDGEGMETIRAVRRKYPAARILAISGGSRLMGARYLLSLAKQLGATDVLAKPFGPADLLAKVNACLYNARPPAC
jgi:DNA-binding response OmpR family regulator